MPCREGLSGKLGKGACFPRPVPLLHLSFPALRQRAALDLIQVARLWLWLWSQQFVCGLCSSCNALRPGLPPRVAAGAVPGRAGTCSSGAVLGSWPWREAMHVAVAEAGLAMWGCFLFCDCVEFSLQNKQQKRKLGPCAGGEGSLPAQPWSLGPCLVVPSGQRSSLLLGCWALSGHSCPALGRT